MASNYWIKLYHEILDDAKMGRLRDNLWRRAIECFLMAGEMQGQGELPSLEDMAWRLRANEEILESELGELANVGILERRSGGWFVTNFADRQSAMSASERGKRWREQQRKQEYYADETDIERDANENQTIRSQKRKEEETDKDRDTPAAVFSAYENNIGVLSEAIERAMGEALEEYPASWIVDAIDIAVERNKRNWRYVLGILKNWQTEGRGEREQGPSPGDAAYERLLWAIRDDDYRSLPGPVKNTLKRMGKGTDDLRSIRENQMSFFRREFIEAYHATTT